MGAVGRAGALVPDVLRASPQFRLLFAGQALSIIGDRVTMVAMPFAVLAAGGGLAEVGIVAGASTAPFLLLTLAAGVWADRRDRRAIMIASDAVRLACQVVAGGLLLAAEAQWWHLAVVAFVYGSADAFFSPAVYGLLPQVVAPAQLQAANALRGLTMSLGLVAGPAAAGLLIAVAGPGGALLADAATFAVSIAFLVALRPSAPSGPAGREATFLAGLRGGWREVRARRWVSSMLFGLAVYHVVVLPSIFVLGPVLAERDLGGASAWATITAAFGAGSVAGQLLLLRLRPARPMLWSAVGLIGASTQAAIIGSGLPVAAIAALEALAAVCVTGFFTLWETSIQEHVPSGAVSRVSSYDLFVAVGLLPVGTVAAGPVAEALGMRATLVGMTVIGVAAGLVVLAQPAVRALRRPPAVPP